MPDFRLQVFVKVAKHLNLTQAAQELGISQPAVSKHMQELEMQYNINLLNRSGGKISLTPAGTLFLMHAEVILDRYGVLEAEMHRISGNYCGEIKISANNPIVDRILFAKFLDFCKKYNCIKISYIEQSGVLYKELLCNNVVDLAFVSGPCDNPELQFTHFAKQKWVFVAHSGGVFADADKVKLDEIINYNLNISVFMCDTTIDYNLLLHDSLCVSYFSDIEMIKCLVLKDDSIGLLPLFFVENELQEGHLKIIDIDGMAFEREVGFLTRKEDTNYAVRSFLEFVNRYNY